MKNLTTLLGFTLGILGFTFSCATETAKEGHKVQEVAVSHYQCPMKCEGEKTYTDSTTLCPVCEMKLVKLEVENSKN